jgi:hypothetical protein
MKLLVYIIFTKKLPFCATTAHSHCPSTCGVRSAHHGLGSITRQQVQLPKKKLSLSWESLNKIVFTSGEATVIFGVPHKGKY